MRIFYDERDHSFAQKHGDKRLYWLDDIGALPITEAQPDDCGFLFTGARPMQDYVRLVGGMHGIRDRPAARAPLLRLDSVLTALASSGAQVPTPRMWALELDAPLPDDITFPLFVRTVDTSWKLGGRISRVASSSALLAECTELRRAFGWDTKILAREWVDLATAGESTYGPLPQEVRVWIIDGKPLGWSFHHLHVVAEPQGFPLSDDDLDGLAKMADMVGAAFQSRLVVADFAKRESGDWIFIEAGPGSCASTAHEAVFKAVAASLLGGEWSVKGDAVGGSLDRGADHRRTSHSPPRARPDTERPG